MQTPASLATLSKQIGRLVRSAPPPSERRRVDRRAADRRTPRYGPVGRLWGADRRWHGDRRSGQDRRRAGTKLSA
ncbi:MAG TPA: hypothetical protein VF872_09460 [Gaiellaceae bacterium]